MQIHIIVLGDSGVGKTSLLTKLNRGVFQLMLPSSVGLDYFSLRLNKWGQDTIVKFWDTAGHERFSSITSSYMKKAHGAMVVASAEHSFLQNLLQFQKHLKLFTKQNESKCVSLIVNKSDLKKMQEKQGIVQGKRKIEELKLLYPNANVYFLSAKTSSKEEIQQVCTHLIKNILNITHKMSVSFLESIVFHRQQRRCINCKCLH